MTVKKSLANLIPSGVLVSLIGIGLLPSEVGLAQVSLQEVYNSAGPGGGYDKLLELDPQEVYLGDLWITGPYHEVCIHGNGALVVPDGNPYAILVYEALLDVDHLVIEAGIVGLFYSNYSSGTVENNTIAGAADYGIRTAEIDTAASVEICGNIVVNNRYGIYCEEDYLPGYIAYNDLWNNAEGNYIKYCGWGGGEQPFAPTPGTGEIHQDPLFRDPSVQDYRLSLGSPCIDAGNPNSPLDPDGTVADIGALYFHHVAEVTLTPNDPPIIIPPQGGRFGFEATITNISDMTVEVDVWTMASVPEIGYYGPLLRRTLHLSPHQILYRPDVSQTVPGFAPEGDYHYIGYVGNYPEKMDSSSFAFSKTGVLALGRWSVDSWSEEVEEDDLPGAASLLGNHPNPFNSTTSISYRLSSSGWVRLEVFNLWGEKVATLVDAVEQAGYKCLTWEASGVSSGVYFCKLALGGYSETKSMLLVK